MTAAIVLIVVAALLILLIAVMAIVVELERVSGITNRESNGWMEAA